MRRFPQWPQQFRGQPIPAMAEQRERRPHRHTPARVIPTLQGPVAVDSNHMSGITFCSGAFRPPTVYYGVILWLFLTYA